jgi:tetratricopeptide (TPR) repeat protein
MLRVGRVRHELYPIEITENQEAVCVVWLDTVIRNNEHARSIHEMLLEVHPDVRLQSEVQSCINLIKTLVDRYILLVTSDASAHEILPEIHSLRSVAAIFVFCSNRELHKNTLMNDYGKIVEIFTDQDSLLKSIEETISLVDKQIHAFTLFDLKQKSVRDPPRGSAAFLWHHLLIYVLRQMSADEQSKQDMLEKCTDYYRGNRRELKKIEQFRETYIREEAIKWYTRDCFLYRLLNKALRTENIELLYSFRFFIIDLCNQLEIQRCKWKKKRVTKLYRGQRMPKEEFMRLQRSIGTLISTNGFLSTSRDLTVSLTFAGQDLEDTDDRYSVLFIIYIDSSLTSFDFADVYDKSEIPSEKEVLLSHDASFKIDSIERNSTFNVWEVKLTATDDGSDYVQQYKLLFQESMKDQSPTVLFGAFLWRDMEYLEHAKMYFEKLLQKLPTNHPDIPFVHNYIAAVYYEKNEWDLALESYQLAYTIRQEQLSPNHAHIIASLHNIGNIYCEKEEFDQALNYYTRALTIDKDNYRIDSLSKAGIYEALGNLFRKKRDLNTALDWLNRAYNMYIRLLPVPHPHIARCLGNIGLVHETKRDLDLALKCFFEEFEMEEESLSPDHPNLGLHLDWIITMYKKKGEWEKILRFCQPKLDMAIPNVSATYSQLISAMRISKDSSHGSTIYAKYYELTTIYSLSPIREIASVEDKFDQLTTTRCIRKLSAGNLDGQRMNENNTYWLHALNIERRVYSTDHPEIVRSLRWVRESNAETVRNYSEVLRMYSESLRNLAREPTTFNGIGRDNFTNIGLDNFERKRFRGTL